ncbi:hypothetical protein MBLNU457_7757t2 [Dothideomycetes sp. NU457]
MPRLLQTLIACLALFACSSSAFSYSEPESAPDSVHQHAKRYGSGEPFWYSQITRQGKIAYGNSSNEPYTIFRNVKDYGAMGDGVTDDTQALNNAMFDGYRCSYLTNCSSQTTTPAIVYFPPGTYLVSAPVIMPYYTQAVGDANDLPVMKGTSDFFGIGLFDSDPYLPYAVSWFQNQNNFWRHVRNFVIDMTLMPTNGQVNGIHWQVAQGTSLQNIVIQMAENVPNNTQIGIFMDNGSGGMFEDLIFNGGGTGLFTGNQQWTARNLTFNNCGTAIYQNWNWVFTYKSVTINNCDIGIDMTAGALIPAVGSLIMLDSTMNNVGIGVLTSFASNSTPVSAGSLILDNVDFVNTPIAVMSSINGTTLVPGNQAGVYFVQGKTYTAYEAQEQVGNLTCYEPTAAGARVQTTVNAPPKPASLLTPDGRIYERSKPQYEGVPLASFVSIIDYGCAGDGVTDDTQCVQDFFNSITTDQIAFIDHGAYVIRDTIDIPLQIKMVGEIWPLFMVDGTSPTFADQDNPKAAFRVGQKGDDTPGAVEMQEIIFETKGPAPGAIMMEWNAPAVTQGSNAMWDVHWRVGGSNGTELQSDNCVLRPNVANVATPECQVSFLLVHLTEKASVLMSNNWGWVSDHELDLEDHLQISIYNGRGLLIESQGPNWIYGSSIEHSMLYNYQVANAKDLYMGHIQSETAYMQSNPNALTPYPPLSQWSDPTFEECFAVTCFKTYGLRIFNSTYILVYGAGLYSFFDNYDSGCLLTNNCQQQVCALEESEGIYLFALNTVGAYNVMEIDRIDVIAASDNSNTFCDTLAVFEYP